METIIRQLKQSWFIFAFLVSVVIWYTNTNARLNTIEAKVLQQEATASQIAQLNIDIAVIKANVEFIKNQVK